jgi:hypothetical protein
MCDRPRFTGDHAGQWRPIGHRLARPTVVLDLLAVLRFDTGLWFVRQGIVLVLDQFEQANWAGDDFARGDQLIRPLPVEVVY